MKMHHVFGKTVTYEQVADALGMNVQTLRTTCAKKYGGNLQSFLSSKGFNKDNIDEMLSCGLIKEPVSNEKQDNDVDTVMRAIYGADYQKDEADRMPEKAEQMPEKAEQMPEKAEQMPEKAEEMPIDAGQALETMTEVLKANGYAIEKAVAAAMVTSMEDLLDPPEDVPQIAIDRAALTEINQTIEQLNIMLDVLTDIDVVSDITKEHVEKAYDNGYHMLEALEKLREQKFMKYVKVDWNAVARGMMEQ